MKLFLDYLRSKLKTAVEWTLFALIFLTVFSLHRLPVRAVLYASVICIFFGAVFIAADYSVYAKKVKTLRSLVSSILYSCDELPIPCNEADRAYAELIRTVFDEKQRLEAEMSAKYSDMIDYYTMWAHQIKTPIAAIRLILQTEDIPQNREISEEIQRIDQYADMVMCYLRLDSSYTDFIFREYDLDGIVRRAVKKFSSQFIRKKLKLCYEPLEVKVLTDEKWLLFVIEQVISNALKYTRSGSISITLEDPLTLCISDTGIGIAAEDLPRIFDKGYTGMAGRLDKKASGIGLYLCRKICDKLGHSISAYSAESGTVIKICLEKKVIWIE